MKGFGWIWVAVVLLAASAAVGQIDVDNRPLKVDPSGPTTPEYRRSIEERNRKAREAAEKAGKTHIDTTFGEFGDQAPKPATSPLTVEAERAGASVSTPGSVRVEVERPGRRTQEHAPDYEQLGEVREGELRELIAELLKALDRKPEMVRLRGERTGKEERAEPVRAAPVTASSGPGLPGIAAGSGFYGRVVYEVNSDFRGPVLVQLLEPPLAGAVVSGRFERVRERLVVRMTRLSWRGRDVAVDAWAVGLDCAC